VGRAQYTDTRTGQDRIGHLVAEDEDGIDRTSEEIAWNSHDTTDMSAEESAMHYDDDGGEEEELSEDVLHDLEDFED
jgi:hypothetical protein